MLLIYLIYRLYLLTNLVLVIKLSSVIRTIKEREVIMIHLNQTNAPLEPAVSSNKLFRTLMLTYSYSIGYPLKKPQARIWNEIPLFIIRNCATKDIDAMIYSLGAITNKLSCAFKTYFLRKTNFYNQYTALARKINISAVSYLMHYHVHRLQKLKNPYELNEHRLLGRYFNATKQDKTAITPVISAYLLGRVIHIPGFSFRSKYNYNQSGKKYHIEMTTNKTDARLNHAKNHALKYSNNSPLIL